MTEKNLMIKNFSSSKTPLTSLKWKNLTMSNRKELISKELKKNKFYEDIEVVDTPDDGQVVIKISKTISASERGLFLLNIEMKLKSEIDEGITIWLEPVGDKSKLRQMRGVKFN